MARCAFSASNADDSIVLSIVEWWVDRNRAEIEARFERLDPEMFPSLREIDIGVTFRDQVWPDVFDHFLQDVRANELARFQIDNVGRERLLESTPDPGTANERGSWSGDYLERDLLAHVALTGRSWIDRNRKAIKRHLQKMRTVKKIMEG